MYKINLTQFLEHLFLFRVVEFAIEIAHYVSDAVHMITVGRLPTKCFVSENGLYTRVSIRNETNTIFISDVFTQVCQKS